LARPSAGRYHRRIARPPTPLLLACALYLLARGLVLHSHFDAVAIPLYELSVVGSLAKVASEGWHGAPLGHYYDNCGGHLVTGFLGVPFYLALGPSYLALKLVPVLLGLGCQLLLWRLLDRWVGRRAANWGAFLFVLGPPTLFKYSMLAKGNHFENLLFQLLTIAAFDRAHAKGLRGRHLFLLGLAAGFAVFFYFGSLATLAALALVQLLSRGPRRALLDLRWVLPGAALGLAPLVWIGLLTAGRPWSFLGHWLGPGERSQTLELWSNARRLFVDVLPQAGCFEDLGPIPGRVAEWAFLACFAAAWLVLLPSFLRGARAALASWRSGGVGASGDLRPALLVLYFPLVVGIVTAGNFRFDPYRPPVEVGQYRYLVPHFLIALMAIAAAVGVLGRRGGIGRRLGTALGTAALATGAFTLPIVDWTFQSTGLGLHYDGFLLRYYNGVALHEARRDPETGSFSWDRAAVVRAVAEFPPHEQREIWFGVGHHLAWSQRMGAGRDGPAAPRLDELVAECPVEAQLDLVRGAGACARGKIGLARLRRELELLAGGEHPLAPYLVEGLGMELQYPLAHRTREDLARTGRIAGAVPEVFAAAFLQGRGIAAGRLLRRGIASDLAAVGQELERPELRDRSELWFGVGWAFSEPGETDGLSDLLGRFVPPAHRGAALLGFGAGLRHAIGQEAGRELSRGLRGALPPAEARALERGLRWEAYPDPLRM